jgi:hypothetical protein
MRAAGCQGDRPVLPSSAQTSQHVRSRTMTQTPCRPGPGRVLTPEPKSAETRHDRSERLRTRA